MKILQFTIFLILTCLLFSCAPFTSRILTNPQYISCSKDDSDLVQISGVNFENKFLADTFYFLTHIDDQVVKVKPNSFYGWADNGFINVFIHSGTHKFSYIKKFKTTTNVKLVNYVTPYGVTHHSSFVYTTEDSFFNYDNTIDLEKKRYTSKEIIQYPKK